MEVLVDGNPVNEAFIGNSTLKDALLHVQSDLCAPAHVVISVRCDGQDISGDAMAATLEQPASSFSQIEVFTGTKETLVTDAMTQASASLLETEPACKRIAELLNEGRTVEAVEALGECLRIWQQIHEAVGKSLQMLELDADKAMIADEPLLEVIGKPKETLLQVKQALESQDHVLLADVLQYEFGEVTEKWRALIAWIRQEAEDRLADTGDAT